MKPKLEIRVADLVLDIRSGLTDSELQEKYKLSPKGLESTMKKLVSSGALGEFGISGQSSLGDWETVVELVRAFPRFYAVSPISIVEAQNPDNKGTVRDISEKGVGTIGLVTRLNQKMTLVVQGDELGEYGAFSFEAECRWCNKSPEGEYLAGFEITEIPDGYFNELKCLIRVYTR